MEETWSPWASRAGARSPLNSIWSQRLAWASSCWASANSRLARASLISGESARALPMAVSRSMTVFLSWPWEAAGKTSPQADQADQEHSRNLVFHAFQPLPDIPCRFWNRLYTLTSDLGTPSRKNVPGGSARPLSWVLVRSCFQWLSGFLGMGPGQGLWEGTGFPEQGWVKAPGGGPRPGSPDPEVGSLSGGGRLGQVPVFQAASDQSPETQLIKIQLSTRAAIPRPSILAISFMGPSHLFGPSFN